MKITILLLVVAACNAKVTNSRSKQREEYEKDKRSSNTNSALEKRTPLLPSVSSTVSPGVEYADTKETLADQSPTQQVYSNQVLSKISDVLSEGQGLHGFQNAIANQLYSPVSVYQPRFPSYEVSQPVPSQLAYAEHSIQPQNQYQPSAQVYQQFDGYQPFQQYEENLPEQLQPQVYRPEVSQNYQQQIKPAPLQPVQNIQQAYIPQSTQGAISYASFALSQQEQAQKGNQPAQYQSQPQQLIKYQLQHQPIRYQPQAQPQAIQYQPQPQTQQIQFQAQPQTQQIHYQQQQPTQQIQYQAQPQIQHIQYQTPLQTLPQPKFHTQVQTQPQIQYQQSQQYEPQYQIQQYQQPQVQLQQYQPQFKSKQNQKQLLFKHFQQPIVLQPQAQPQAEVKPQYTQPPTQNLGYSGPIALPTFPPVQYFGKFAHSIFGQQV